MRLNSDRVSGSTPAVATFALVAAFVFVPTLLIRTGAALSGFGGPLIDVDILGCGILVALGYRRVGALGVGIAILLRLISSVGAIFHFTAGDALTALLWDFRRLSGLATYGKVALAIAGAVALAMGAHRVGRHVGRSSHGALVLAGILLMAAIADVAKGSNVFSRPDDVQRRVNVAGSGLLRLWRFTQISAEMAEQDRELRRTGTDVAIRASFSPDSIRGNAQRPNMVIVLVESWGLLSAPAAADAFTVPFLSSAMRERYKVRVGSVPFAGATTAAEFRELCGRYGNHYSALHTSATACLPAMMRNIGYQTTAMHGFTGAMFERRDWYARFGFESRIFREQLPGVPQCGRVFIGACDSSMVALLRTRLLSATSPQFIYWVTLDSHLPLDPKLARAAGRCPAALARLTASDCAHAAIILRTLQAVAALAEDPKLRATRFVLVGDHPPPFLLESDRAAYSTSQVPYVVLEPRAAPADDLLPVGEVRTILARATP